VTSSAIGLENFYDATSMTSQTFCISAIGHADYKLSSETTELEGWVVDYGTWRATGGRWLECGRYRVIPGFVTERQNDSLCLSVIKQILAERRVAPHGWGHCASGF